MRDSDNGTIDKLFLYDFLNKLIIFHIDIGRCFINDYNFTFL